MQRGKEYYSNGHVISIEETSGGRWTAEVEGSETYNVQVTVKQGYKISEYSCDCPFDGDVCKHVAAVFFALRNGVRNADIPSKKPLKKEVFANLLQSLSKKEHQDFIRSYAAGNKDFKTAFELFFADKDNRIDVQKKYHELVQKMIRKHTRQGFIDYRESMGLSKELDNLIKTGFDYVSKNNFRDALALVKAMLKPLMDVITYSDDSGGRIGYSIENVISLLETIAMATSAAIDIKEQIFAFLQAELNNEDYFDYGDFGYSLFNIWQQLAIKLNKSTIFLEYVDSQIHKIAGKRDNYRRDYFQKEKIAFFKQSGKLAEAETLVQQSMNIVDVRAQVINQAIAKRDFATAKKIIAEGIKIAKDNGHPGTVIQWQKELLRIAILEKNTATIRQYTKYFAFDRGFSAEYYKQWKATFTIADWQIEIEKHIAETIRQITKEWNSSKNKYWKREHPPLLQNLGPTYVQENFLDRLLVLVQQENDLLPTLAWHPYLVKDYPNELLAIYLPALEAYGIESNGRSQYADLVYKMKIIIKDIPEGKEKILHVAKRLIDKFSIKPRRPAMIDELNKIL